MMSMDENQNFSEVMEKARFFSENHIKPRARETDFRQQMPRDLISEIARLNLFSVIFPQRFGGYDFNPVEYGLFLEEICKYCSNIRNLFLVNVSMVGGTILKWGTKNQIDEWLPQMISGKKI